MPRIPRIYASASREPGGVDGNADHFKTTFRRPAQNQKETHRKRAELLVATRRHRRGMARTTGATVRTWRFHSRPAALLRPPFCPFIRVALFFLAAAPVKEKTSRHRQNGKNMKLEEVNLKTKEAVD